MALLALEQLSGIFAEGGVRSTGEVCLIFLGNLVVLGKTVGGYPVIAVEEEEVLAVSVVNDGVTGCAKPLVAIVTDDGDALTVWRS